MRWIVVTALLAAFGFCHAQTVYKCKDKSGAPVFSQQPCATDPRQVETIEVKGIGKTDPEAAAAQRASEEASFVASGIARRERECIASRANPIESSSNARVAGYEQRIAVLQQKIRLANNNLAGATYESGIRNEIAALQTSISTEQSSAGRLISDAISACADDRKREEDRAREDGK